MKTFSDFNSLDWHDAELIGVAVDRRMPGKNDIVIVEVRWPDSSCQGIIFTDCYAFNAQMNFGVLAPESIRSASCVTDSVDLRDVRRRWSNIDIDLRSLCCFEIRTNSTNSILQIFALGWDVALGTSRLVDRG